MTYWKAHGAIPESPVFPTGKPKEDVQLLWKLCNASSYRKAQWWLMDSRQCLLTLCWAFRYERRVRPLSRLGFPVGMESKLGFPVGTQLSRLTRFF